MLQKARHRGNGSSTVNPMAPPLLQCRRLGRPRFLVFEFGGSIRSSGRSFFFFFFYLFFLHFTPIIRNTVPRNSYLLGS